MKTKTILTLALAVITAGGCVQMESNAVLNADGSGTCSVHYVMPLEVEDALRELMAMNSKMTAGYEDVQLIDESFDRGALEAELKPLGVTITSFETGEKGTDRVADLSFAFKDAEGLQAAMAIAGGGQNTLGVRKTANGDYVLKVVEGGGLAAGGAEEEFDPAEMDMDDMNAAMQNAAKSMELMGALMAHTDKLSIVSKITLPGEIKKQNAHRCEGSTCVWEINSGNMMQAQTMPPPYIVFSGKGLSLDVPEE